jgi:hypothetical protein
MADRKWVVVAGITAPEGASHVAIKQFVRKLSTTCDAAGCDVLLAPSDQFDAGIVSESRLGIVVMDDLRRDLMALCAEAGFTFESA